MKSTEDVLREATVERTLGNNTDSIYQNAIEERDQEITRLGDKLGRLEHLITTLLAIAPLDERQIWFLDTDKTGLKKEFEDILV